MTALSVDAERGRAVVRRLSTGLVAYGIAGLLLTVVGLASIVWVNDRFDALAQDAGASVTRLTETLDRTAIALDDAASTASSFSGTLDQTVQTVSGAAETIRGIRTPLQSLESLFRGINILGASPLGGAADLVGEIAGRLEGLDTRLDAIAASLTDNRAKLTANADSLSATSESIAALSAQLKAGVVSTGIDDLKAVILLILFMMVVWTSVPAIGALGFGVWLRRESGGPA